MKNRIKIIYRLLLICLGLYGLYLNLFSGYGNITEMLRYFTILSNIIVVIFFIFLVINCKKNSPHLKGAITMAITVTFLIFHFMLRPTLFDMANSEFNMYSPANLLMHYIIPIMTILDWLIFDIKGQYKWYDPIIWLLIPLAYFIIMSINGLLGYTFSSGSHYPYFFMDWDTLGIKVLLYVLIIIIAFTILGYIFYGIDKLLRRKNGNYQSK